MKKTGLLFGSFNPIHIGHTVVANYICEFHELDEIWFVVTPQSPLKDKVLLADAAQRLEMTKLAIAAYPKFKVCDIEFGLPQPNYTINTLDTLCAQNPDNDFYFIIGADNWLQMPRWKDYDRICSDYKLLIYPRHNYEAQIPIERAQNICLTNAPRIEISSSFIREAIGNRKNICEFLQHDVYNYILSKKLYNAQ